MTIAKSVIAAIFVAASFTPLTAVSQDRPQCWARADALAHLAIRYDERPVAIGTINDSRIMEVFASPDGKTFTVMITDTMARSCMAIAGESYVTMTYTPPGDPS